jgi:hypothetical protein
MAKKTMAKVSPARGMSVEAWVKAKAKGWQGELVHKLVAVAKAAAPGGEVTIKWNQPVLVQNGPVAFIKPAKAHVTFGFWRGAQLSDPKGTLEGGDRMKHLKLPSADALDEAQLKRWVKEAVALNVKLGDPSKR